MDCSVEFTKSSRAVSIVIVWPCEMPRTISPFNGRPEPLPIPAICRAVNPRIPKSPFRTGLPVRAAVLHTPRTSLESSGMPLSKHATCGPRTQVPICYGTSFLAKRDRQATPSSYWPDASNPTARFPWRLGGRAGGHPGRDRATVASAAKEHPPRCQRRLSRTMPSLNRQMNIKTFAYDMALDKAPRASPATRDRTPGWRHGRTRVIRPPGRRHVLSANSNSGSSHGCFLGGSFLGGFACEVVMLCGR